MATKIRRFQLVFTPTRGSWRNLIEVDKLTGIMLREIRVASKSELAQRLRQSIREIDAPSVLSMEHKWMDIYCLAIKNYHLKHVARSTPAFLANAHSCTPCDLDAQAVGRL
jgi:hypothetical protein